MTQLKILPSSFALDKETFEKKLKMISSFSSYVHLDIMDGKFTPNASYPFEKMDSIKNYPNHYFQAHFMTLNPLQYLEKVVEFGVEEVLVQIEVFASEEELSLCLDSYKTRNVKIGLVINPKTKLDSLLSYVNQVEKVLVMTVTPGAENQSFNKEMIQRIEKLKSQFPQLIVEVDGGIKAENIQRVRDAGADEFVVGSYITGDRNPKLRFNELQGFLKK